MEILERRVAYAGWMTLSVVAIRLSDGRTTRREVVEHGRAASVLPYDAERRTAVLVRQLRAPVLMLGDQAPLPEAIAGMLDGDDSTATARREAMEEAGLQLGELEFVAETWTSPGILTERLTLFLAPYRAADRIGSGGGLAEEHEEIEVVELPLGELAALADSGQLADMKTFALVQSLRLRKPELFT